MKKPTRVTRRSKDPAEGAVSSRKDSLRASNSLEGLSTRSLEDDNAENDDGTAGDDDPEDDEDDEEGEADDCTDTDEVSNNSSTSHGNGDASPSTSPKGTSREQQNTDSDNSTSSDSSNRKSVSSKDGNLRPLDEEISRYSRRESSIKKLMIAKLRAARRSSINQASIRASGVGPKIKLDGPGNAPSKRVQTKLQSLTKAINNDDNSRDGQLPLPPKRPAKLGPIVLAKRPGKYERISYPLASVVPTVEGREKLTSDGSDLMPVRSLVLKKINNVNFPTRSGKTKNYVVGYKSPPSSGLSFVPISEQQTLQSQKTTATSSRVSLGQRLFSWDTYDRRVQYDQIVRCASRQSNDVSRQMIETAKSICAQKKLSAADQSTTEENENKRVDLKDNLPSSDPADLNMAQTLSDSDSSIAIDAARGGNVVFESEVGSGNLNQHDTVDGSGGNDVVGGDGDDVPNDAEYPRPRYSVVPSGTPSVPDAQVSPENMNLLRLAGVFKAKPDKPNQPQMQWAGNGPGDVIYGRRDYEHANLQEINLLTSTTGQFRGGLRDPHQRFLRRHFKGVKLSGPNGAIPTAIAPQYYRTEKKSKERVKNDHFSKHRKRIQGAQALREHSWAMSRQKYLVGPATSGFVRNENGVMVKERDEKLEDNEMRLLKVSNPAKYKRLIEKEKAKSFLLTKWETVEQLRIQIIAKTLSLKEFHEYFQQLHEENEELRLKFKEISAQTNTKISETLEQNETYTLDIIRIDREKKAQLQALDADFEEFVAKSDKLIAKYTHDADMTLQTVHRITHEINKLMEFKAMKESNPKAIANKVKEAQKERDEHIMQFNAHLDQITAAWKIDQEEIEQTWTAKVKAIIDGMGNSLEGQVDTSPQGNYFQNGRLRHEISLHRSQAEKAQADINNLLKARREMKKMQGTLVDRRKAVMKLKEQMTCTPQMEFEVTPKQFYQGVYYDTVRGVQESMGM
ncbi:hypothetical protein HDU84_004404 [Entophlyctis sp. JEL0112]|nr:hypothetical protein HDU84_004404 [Entophlyctis sp. JEL0112]